jgi:anti-anti-sigma factor
VVADGHVRFGEKGKVSTGGVRVQELLSIEISRGAPTRLKLRGGVDYTTGRMLSDAIASLGDEDLVIDCRGLANLDLFGIEILVEMGRDYERRGRSVVLENLNRDVRRTLETCGLLGSDGRWSVSVSDDLAT